MKRLQLPVLVMALALVAFPWGAGAISSTSYQLDPEGGLNSSHSGTGTSDYDLSSTSYQLDAAVDSYTGSLSSSSYGLEAGDSFEYYCGDGFRDPTETCDGTDVDGATCASNGFDSGTISCASNCSLDTSLCVTASGGGGGGGGGGGSSDPDTPTISEEIETLEFTYTSPFLLYGGMDDNTDRIEINGDDSDVDFVDDDNWKASVALSYGLNSFDIEAFDGTKDSGTLIYEIYRRLIGDVNEDDTVNDYDLSQLVGLWGEDDREGDFNEDGVVDDYDFSMMVARWGTSV